MADQCGPLHVRANHHSRAIHQAQHGDVEGIAKLDEAGALVGPVGVDGTREMVGVVGDDAHRVAFHADQGRDDADAELLADLEYRSDVGDGAHDLLHVVQPQPVLWHDMAQASLIVGFPFGYGALEVRQVPLRHFHGFLFVLGEQIDYPVRDLERHRSDFLRRVDAKPATFDHGGTAHGDGGALGGDDHVAAGDERRVAGEGPAVDDADQRHEAGELGELGERIGVEGDARSLAIVAGPAAAALAEEDQRDAEPLRQFEHPVLLVVVATPLGSGQHRVVVVHEHGAGRLFAEQVRVDGAQPGDESVRGRVPAQGLHVVARMLAGDDQRPVLLERTGVDQLVDVLAGHAVAPAVALGDGFGPVLVQDVGVALVGEFEVGTDVVGIEFLRGCRGTAADFGFFHEDDRISLANDVAFRHGDLADDAVGVGGNDMLHLHGLDHRDRLTLADLVVHDDIERHDRPLYGRTQTR